MAVLQLPTLTDGTPHYVFRTQLEGQDYQFTLRFGERRGCWVFDLSTLDGVDIILGQVVTVGRDLLRRAAMAERPPGQLWVMHLSPPTTAQGGMLALPGLYDLGPGGLYRLFYTESTTLEDNIDAGIVEAT